MRVVMAVIVVAEKAAEAVEVEEEEPSNKMTSVMTMTSRWLLRRREEISVSIIMATPIFPLETSLTSKELKEEEGTFDDEKLR